MPTSSRIKKTLAGVAAAAAVTASLIAAPIGGAPDAQAVALCTWKSLSVSSRVALTGVKYTFTNNCYYGMSYAVACNDWADPWFFNAYQTQTWTINYWDYVTKSWRCQVLPR